jgi:hypothetical protein
LYRKGKARPNARQSAFDRPFDWLAWNAEIDDAILQRESVGEEVVDANTGWNTPGDIGIL